MKQEYNKNPIYRVLYLFIGFYRFVGTVVLYIPLKLQEESVDTIVVVEKEEVKNEQYYAVRTILNPHDNIYKTARVLSIVESEWVKNTI